MIFLQLVNLLAMLNFIFCTVETQPNQRISLSNWTGARGGAHLFVSQSAALCVLVDVEDNAERNEEWLELGRREGWMDCLVNKAEP